MRLTVKDVFGEGGRLSEMCFFADTASDEIQLGKLEQVIILGGMIVLRPIGQRKMKIVFPKQFDPTHTKGRETDGR